MKYIIIRRQDRETAIIFPEWVNHSDAVNSLEVKPVSAGFCAIKDGQVETFGDSTSLSLRPRPQDAAIIDASLFVNGLLPSTESRINAAIAIMMPAAVAEMANRDPASDAWSIAAENTQHANT